MTIVENLSCPICEAHVTLSESMRSAHCANGHGFLAHTYQDGEVIRVKVWDTRRTKPADLKKRHIGMTMLPADIAALKERGISKQELMDTATAIVLRDGYQRLLDVLNNAV